MSPAQDFSEPVRQVSEALDALIVSTSQLERARAVGLKVHTNISRLEEAVARGDSSSYLEAYGIARVILLQKAFPEFAAAHVAAISPNAQPAEPERCSDTLVEVASTCTRSIDAIVQRLPQGLTVPELLAIEENLSALLTTIQRARINIGRQIRSGRGD